MILEAFEAYCRRHGIHSEQYKEEIFPVFAAGFNDGQKLFRKAIQKGTEIHYNLNRRGNPA